MNTAAQPLISFLRTAVPMWVGTIFVVAGSVAAYTSFGEWRDARRFDRESQTARAEVLETSLERASRDGNQRTRYLLIYRFTPAGGAPIERTEEIPVEEWETLAAGGSIDVRYLPEDPSTARTRRASPAWVPPLVVGVTTLFAILGVVIALPWWRRALVLWRVQRTGVTAQAKVVEVAEAGIVVNRVPQWRLVYEYRDERGVQHRGQSDLMRPHEAAQWQPGEAGMVRFDRDRSADSFWLGRR